MQQNGVRYGLIGALALVLLSLAIYFINPRSLYSPVMYVAWAIYLGLMYKSAIDDKADNGGFLEFRQAFQSAFVVFVIASLVHTLFTYILTTIIDPSLLDIQKEIALESVESVAGMMKASEEQLDAMVEAIEEQGTPSIGQMTMGYAVNLIFGALPALIIAIIVRKKRPPMVEEQEDLTEHIVE